MITSNIKEMMVQKGITLKRMAEDTGLAEMTLIRARRKQIIYCRLCTLKVIAEYLGVKTKELYEEN